MSPRSKSVTKHSALPSISEEVVYEGKQYKKVITLVVQCTICKQYLNDIAQLSRHRRNKHARSMLRPVPNPTKSLNYGGELMLKLENAFELNPNPSLKERKELAPILGLDEKNIKTWFYKRRSKNTNKKSKFFDGETLTALEKFKMSVPNPTRIQKHDFGKTINLTVKQVNKWLWGSTKRVRRGQNTGTSTDNIASNPGTDPENTGVSGQGYTPSQNQPHHAEVPTYLTYSSSKEYGIKSQIRQGTPPSSHFENFTPPNMSTRRSGFQKLAIENMLQSNKGSRTTQDLNMLQQQTGLSRIQLQSSIKIFKKNDSRIPRFTDAQYTAIEQVFFKDKNPTPEVVVQLAENIGCTYQQLNSTMEIFKKHDSLKPRFTGAQYTAIEKLLFKDKNPTPEVLVQLAEDIGLTYQQLNKYFCYHRRNPHTYHHVNHLPGNPIARTGTVNPLPPMLNRNPIIFNMLLNNDPINQFVVEPLNPDILRNDVFTLYFVVWGTNNQHLGISIGFTSMIDVRDAAKCIWDSIRTGTDRCCSYRYYFAERGWQPYIDTATSFGIYATDKETARTLKFWLRLRCRHIGTLEKHESINCLHPHAQILDQTVRLHDDLYPEYNRGWLEFTHADMNDHINGLDNPRSSFPGINDRRKILYDFIHQFGFNPFDAMP